jgi:hypothetical protein
MKKHQKVGEIDKNMELHKKLFRNRVLANRKTESCSLQNAKTAHHFGAKINCEINRKDAFKKRQSSGIQIA